MCKTFLLYTAVCVVLWPSLSFSSTLLPAVTWIQSAKSVGEPVQLGCNLSAVLSSNSSNVKQIFWTINRKIVSTAVKLNGNFKVENFARDITGEVQNVNNQQTSVISIQKLVQEYTGDIQCIVKSNDGTILYESFSRLIIPNEEIEVPFAASYTIQCPRHMKPQLGFSWFRDGEILLSDDATGRKRDYFTISYMNKEDVGTYLCEIDGMKIQSFNVTTSFSDTPSDHDYSLLGTKGIVVGVFVGIIVASILLISIFLQKYFPVPGYSDGALVGCVELLTKCMTCSCFSSGSKKSQRQRVMSCVEGLA